MTFRVPSISSRTPAKVTQPDRSLRMFVSTRVRSPVRRTGGREQAASTRIARQYGAHAHAGGHTREGRACAGTNARSATSAEVFARGLARSPPGDVTSRHRSCRKGSEGEPHTDV